MIRTATCIYLLSAAVAASIFGSQCRPALGAEKQFILSAADPGLVLPETDGYQQVRLLAEDKAVVVVDRRLLLDEQVKFRSAVIVTDLTTGRMLQKLDWDGPLSKRFCELYPSPDGRFLLMAVGDPPRQPTVVHAIDWASGERLWTFDDPKASIRRQLAISPDGRTVALLDGLHIRLLDLVTGNAVQTLGPHANEVNSLAFSPDGKYLLACVRTNSRLWDLGTGTDAGCGTLEPFSQVAFLPDGERIVGWVSDRVGARGTMVVHVRSGRRLLYIDQLLGDFALSPDGKRLLTTRLASEGRERGLPVRDLETGKILFSLPVDPHIPGMMPHELQISPDGRHAMAALESGQPGRVLTRQVWSLRDDAVALYKSRPPEEMSPPADAPLVTVGSTDEEKVRLIFSLVQDLAKKGQREQAAAELDKAVDMARRLYASDQPRLESFLLSAAAAYSEPLGQHAKAERYVRESGRLAAARLGPNNPTLVSQLRSLGQVCARQEKYEEALQALQRAHQLAVQHEDVWAHPLRGEIAGMYEKLHRFDEAEREMLRVQAEAAEQRGHSSVTIESSALAMSRFYSRIGRWQKIAPLYAEKLAHEEKLKGVEHVDVGRTAEELGRLYYSLGDWKKAAGLLDRSRRILRNYVCQQLPSLSEGEQLSYLAGSYTPALHRALSFGFHHRDEPGVPELTAEWVLNGKAIASRALAERSRIAMGSRDPKVRAIANELQEVRSRIAAMAVGKDERSAAEVIGQRVRQLTELREKEEKLSWQLGLAGWTELREDPWVELAAVRKRLPVDSVLVEIARTVDAKIQSDFQPGVEPQSTWGTVRYLAWVIPPEGRGEVQLIELGANEEITQGVVDFHRALFVAGVAIARSGEEAAAKVVQAPLQQLSRAALQPLLPHIGDAQSWIISPDGVLWLVPWSALPLDDGQFAIERYRTSYLLSGRELAAAADPIPTGAAVIVANPDYDFGILADAGATPRPFGPLPGTAEEARQIAPRLARLIGSAPAVHTGVAALESVIKSSHQPQVLVLSTHGYLLQGDRQQNPLAACGLAFAGANAHPPAGGGAADDGVLTGIEIVGTDLRGTDLVVLSACQTGLGHLQEGEGVAGLKQAFHLAGAKTVAATLWSIPDLQTAALMTAFFDNLATGQSKPDALRAAQMAMIKSLREKHGVANPLYWAAFTLTGQ